MNDTTKPEEKSPLLLYVVEGDGNNVSKNNKRVNFDKGRLYGISSGATTIFTDFPNYISPCWLTALISSLILFMMMLMMISTLSTSSVTLRVPRCLHSNTPKHLDNNTLHLVHPVSDWSQEQLEILDKIKKEFKGFTIRLTLIHPEPVPINVKIHNITSQTTASPLLQNSSSLKLSQEVLEIKKAKRAKKLLKKRKRRDDFGVNFGMKGLLDILLKGRNWGIRSEKRSGDEQTTNDTNEINTLLKLTETDTPITTPKQMTLDDIICDWPSIVITNVTHEQIFQNTPLSTSWSKLSPELAYFAIRVLELWQHGGLSFKIDDARNGTRATWDDVEEFTVTPGYTSPTITEPFDGFQPFVAEPSPKDKLTNFIMQGKKSFKKLRREVVTADDEGLHIFAKTPCHVFFGQILVNLKNCRGHESPRSIIQKSLQIFCKHSAVGNGYCRNLEGVNQRA